MVIDPYSIKDYISRAMFAATTDERIRCLVCLSKYREPEIGWLLQILMKENKL